MGTMDKVSVRSVGLPIRRAPTHAAKKTLFVSIVLVLLLCYVSNAIRQETQDKEAVIIPLAQLAPGKTFWHFLNFKELQSYLYDPSKETITPYLTLEKGDDVQISPNSDKITKSNSTVIETSSASINPRFKQVHRVPAGDTIVSLRWLPDNSGLIFATASINDAENEEFTMPEESYTNKVFYINYDGSGLRHIFTYFGNGGKIEIDKIDQQRNEIYIGENGEGGGRVAAAVYNLLDGRLVKALPGEQKTPIFRGEIYRIGTAPDTGIARITATNLLTDKQRVLYAAKHPTSGISTLNLSDDLGFIYFNELTPGQKSTTVLTRLDLKNNSTTAVYSPAKTDQTMIEAQASDTDEVIALTWCGDCVSNAQKQYGFTYIYRNIRERNVKIIRKSTDGPILRSFQHITIVK